MLDSGVAVVVVDWVEEELCGVVESTVEVLVLLDDVDDMEMLTVLELMVVLDEVVVLVMLVLVLVVLVLVEELTELLLVVEPDVELVLLVVELEEAVATNSRIRLFPESATQMSPEPSATRPEGEARLLCPVPAPSTPVPGWPRTVEAL